MTLDVGTWVAPFPADIARLVDQVYPIARQQMAVQLAAATHLLYWLDVALQLTLLLLFYFSTAAARLRQALERRIHRPFLLAAAYIVLLVIGLSLAMLPTTFYGTFTLTHRFGLSSEPLSRWLRDWAVGTVVTALITALVGGALLRVIARFRNWPVIASLAAGPLIFFASAVFPLWIAPLFNTFTPLTSSALTRSILELAHEQGINASVVYQYDMSTQTNEADAYVAGLGKTERIAVGDTLLRGLKPDEVLYVMAHEMGHYKLKHLWLGSLEASAGAVIAITWVALAGTWAVRRFPGRSRSLSDPAATALIGALVIVFEVITAPVANAFSRNIEHAADAFAAGAFAADASTIKHKDLGDAGVRTFARLANQDLSVLHPSALTVWYFYTHPPPGERIVFAAEHKRGVLFPHYRNRP